MKQTNFLNVPSVLLTLIIFVFCAAPVSAYIIANESDIIFPDDNTGGTGGTGTGGTGTDGTGTTQSRIADTGQPQLSSLASEPTSIRGGVIEGAASILQSQADYLELLNIIERSEKDGLDFANLNTLADNAIAHAVKAVSTYETLTGMADSSAYDSTISDQLAAFDYTSFKNQRGLNAIIFDRAVFYLEKSDIRGVYHELLKDSRSLLTRLQAIKAVIANNQFPPVTDLWRANQAFSETVLFGQYVAEVFFEIAGK